MPEKMPIRVEKFLEELNALSEKYGLWLSDIEYCMTISCEPFGTYYQVANCLEGDGSYKFKGYHENPCLFPDTCPEYHEESRIKHWLSNEVTPQRRAELQLQLEAIHKRELEHYEATKKWLDTLPKEASSDECPSEAL